MCGIAGHVGHQPPASGRIERALELLRHRGPDDLAHRTFTTPDGRHVTLLHARLSIIDLDPRANQPMRCGSQWLAYNGELYKYPELRERLERGGGEVGTPPPTEGLWPGPGPPGRAALAGLAGVWAV